MMPLGRSGPCVRVSIDSTRPPPEPPAAAIPSKAAAGRIDAPARHPHAGRAGPGRGRAESGRHAHTGGKGGGAGAAAASWPAAHLATRGRFGPGPATMPPRTGAVIGRASRPGGGGLRGGAGVAGVSAGPRVRRGTPAGRARARACIRI